MDLSLGRPFLKKPGDAKDPEQELRKFVDMVGTW